MQICIGGCILFYLLHFCRVSIAVLAQEILLEQATADLDSLIFVHAIWRHGARTPSTLMANDLRNNLSTWELGLGEVTTKGLGQCYRLGKWIRGRYNGFLSTKYDPFEVYIRSSDYNRTLMSAQAVLAALYKPGEEDEHFQQGLNWRPIPVHTTAKPDDKIISDDCQSATDEAKRIFQDAKAKQIETENLDFLRFLAEKSGYSNKESDHLPLRELRYVFDPLYCQLENGGQMPEWVNESVRQRVWRLFNVTWALQFSTEQIIRIRGGKLFTEIVDRMESVLNGTADRRQKLHAYSAHDSTIASILRTFGIRPASSPRFATLVLVELHKKAGQNWVRLFYKNETDGERLWEWPIAGCPPPCLLDKLKKARGRYLMESGENGCFEPTILTREKVYIALILLLSFLSATLAVFIFVDHHRRKAFPWSSTKGSVAQQQQRG